LPRISVDIDLTYVLINNRVTALEDISRSIESIKSYAFGYREDI
jgi:hypothetical protein